MEGRIIRTIKELPTLEAASSFASVNESVFNSEMI